MAVWTNTIYQLYIQWLRLPRSVLGLTMYLRMCHHDLKYACMESLTGLSVETHGTSSSISRTDSLLFSRVVLSAVAHPRAIDVAALWHATTSFANESSAPEIFEEIVNVREDRP